MLRGYDFFLSFFWRGGEELNFATQAESLFNTQLCVIELCFAAWIDVDGNGINFENSSWRDRMKNNLLQEFPRIARTFDNLHDADLVKFRST